MTSAMKDSGITGVGKVRDDWNIQPLKSIAVISRGGSPRPIEHFLSSDDSGYNWIRIGDSIKGSKYIKSTLRKIISEGLSKTRFIKRGSLILSNSMSFGQPYILDIDGCIHDGWVAFSDVNVDQEFLYYFLMSEMAMIQFQQQVAGGVVQNLNVDKIGSTRIAVPEREEQVKIVKFLDAKCARIDAVIEQTRASIEEYKKLKQAVITRAVTKGLRPDRPMKGSGIEWIGEIPEDWDVIRIKYLCNKEIDSFQDGDWIESPFITDSGIRYLTTGNVGDGIFKRQGKGYISEDTFVELHCKYAYPNDLVISRLNEPYGRACILPSDEEKYVLAVDLVILRTDHDKRYLCYLMQCQGYQDAVQDNAKGTTMKRISRTNLGNIPLPIPPLAQQYLIVNHLDKECASIAPVIEQKTRLIEELESYKKSLIFEYVTGKKEVL